jgi:hypothetical protein
VIHSRAVETLGDLERRYPVATWTADGLHLWPLLRVKLGKSIIATARRAARVETPEPRVQAGELAGRWAGDVAGLARRGVERFADRRNTLHRVPRADALFWTRPANRQRLESGWYDRFFDPLGEILATQSRRALALEKPDRSGLHRFPRHGPSMLVRWAVRRREWAATLDVVSKRPEPVAGYADLQRDLNAIFPDVEVPSWGKLMREVRYVRRLERWFGDILDRSGARAVLATYYYNPMVMALCLAAHARGVPSVDVQHGVTRQNPAYEGWTAFPEGGYPLLPSHFWCWSEDDAEPVRGWPDPVRAAHRTIVGGHPWMAFWQGSSALIDPYRERAAALRGDGLNVLVSLTWSARLSPLLRALLRASPADWSWWVRLHPLMDADRAEIQALCAADCAARVIVDAPSDLPLPLLLDQADVHVTHNSSVVQEATAMGLPSVVIDEKARAMYPRPIASGWARCEVEPDSILRAVRDQAEARSGLPGSEPYPSWDAMARAVNALFA